MNVSLTRRAKAKLGLGWAARASGNAMIMGPAEESRPRLGITNFEDVYQERIVL
jgi:hypothetical protein